MSTFAGTPFKVRVDQDGFFPQPARDSEGIARYQAEIMVTGSTAFLALQGKVSRGTPKMVNGSMVTNWHNNAGTGTGSLQVPFYRGLRKTYTKAILVSLTSRGSGDYAGPTPIFFCDAEWIIISPIT